MNGGVFTLGGEGVVFSNVELVPVPGGLTYSSATPFMFQYEGTEDGKGIVTITPVHTYSLSSV